MHVTRRVLEGAGDGQAVLCHGPPLTGKREFLVTLVGQAVAAGHPALFVTTDENAAGLLSRYPDAFPADRTGIVDCTDSRPPETGHVVHRVASAADLTGIAVAVSKALDELDHGDRPVVVVVDSVTTLTLYAAFGRVFRFLHSFIQQVRDRGGVVAFSLDDDSVAREERSRFLSIADSRVECRNAAECRLVDEEGGASEWRRLEDPGTVTVDAGEAATAAATDSAAPGVERQTHTSQESLAALIAAVRQGRPTLTFGNVPSETDVGPLVERAQRHAVGVEELQFGGGVPAGVAMLHDGAELLAAGALEEAVVGIDDPFGDVDGTRSSVVEALPTDVFATNEAGRGRLLRASRTVERLALREGSGTVHAGFQLFSRLTRDRDTVGVYERLLAEGVEVHLYGELDASLPEPLDGAVVRGLPAEEVGDAWFVVYDGDTDAGGALVTRELEPGRYDGFWSYDGAVVERALDYLETEYGAVEA
ncbi:hypothetical protein N0B31_00990 [Salinirubellus salinus]|uniref:Recombinase RecA n=1 Tax=Salinirubellus salinus TaxID=1364945 RepID=A0A9E7R357_9EURY|nr:hypothetical protein [Salinirubellus salinus]UWM54869.1 hypothetical protein N0B31_00990 [Salinirubellus salinus]